MRDGRRSRRPRPEGLPSARDRCRRFSDNELTGCRETRSRRAATDRPVNPAFCLETWDCRQFHADERLEQAMPALHYRPVVESRGALGAQTEVPVAWAANRQVAKAAHCRNVRLPASGYGPQQAASRGGCVGFGHADATAPAVWRASGREPGTRVARESRNGSAGWRRCRA